MDVTQQVEQVPPQAPEQPPAPEAPVAPEAAPAKSKSMLPIIGGILVLVVGIVGIILSIVGIIIADEIFDWMGDLDTTGTLEFLETACMVIGAIGVIFSLIAILGGYFGIMRKKFGLAVVGGVFAILVGIPLFYFYYVWPILAIVGLILIIISHKDFS